MKLGKAKKILGLILAVTVAAGAAGCGKQAAKDGDGARVVRIAHTQAYVPYDFVNEQGESDGFEVAVMQEVAKLLPQYKFEFVPTSDDDLLIGVQSGKYDAGTKGA